MSTPKWLTKDLLETALRDYFHNGDVQILGSTSKSAVPTGDNYTSDLFRSSITYLTGKNGEKKTISVIIKCSPQEVEINKIGQEMKLFEKEAEMFYNTLPAIHRILGQSATLSAQCIYYTKEPQSMIIFEDLSKLGFVNRDRKLGFDLDHCLIIVEKLAKLHAGSLVLFEQNPSSMNNYTDGLFSEIPALVLFAKTAIESVTKVASTWPGYEKYSLKLKAISDKIVERCIKASDKKLGGFNVLNHGDMWLNNMMFSYDEDKKLKDFRFVDFQLVKFTSPAVDLHYFWATSPSIEVRREHFDKILDHYYSSLLWTLSCLNYNLDRVPTRAQFRKDWEERAAYGFLAAAAILPITKASSRSDATFADLMKNDDEGSFRHHAYNNERFRKHMEFLFSFYGRLGVFDY